MLNKARRIGAFLAATVAAVALTSSGAAPASAADTTAPPATGPQPVSALLSTAHNNEASWVSVWWKTDQRICDAKLVVWGQSRVDIGYPGSTRHYTSFSNGGTLDPRETDFTSFRVTPHYGGSAWVILAGIITYDSCGRPGRTQSMSTGLLLPVRNRP